MSNPVFFVRRYNDIDHIAPVVHRVAQQHRGPVHVLCLNPALPIFDDFRMRFLGRGLGNVHVDHVYNLAGKGLQRRLVAACYCENPRPPDNVEGGAPPIARGKRSVRARTGLRMLVDRLGLAESTFDVDWAQELCRDLDASVLVFDHVKRHQHVVGALMEAAGAMGIATVGLPHGLPLAEEGHVDGPPPYIDTGFDHLVEPHRWVAAQIEEAGFPQERLHVLGSARFCDEWRTTLGTILPSARLPDAGPGKLRVLYMERGADRHGARAQLIQDTLGSVARLPFVSLTIKAHTRSNRLHFDVAGPIHIDYDSNSVSLIEAADVVIGTISSIVVEAICQRKPFLHPSFFHDYRMHFDRLRACWTVDTPAALSAALEALSRDPMASPVAETSVREFLAALVYAGRPDESVLERYASLIRRAANA